MDAFLSFSKSIRIANLPPLGLVLMLTIFLAGCANFENSGLSLSRASLIVQAKAPYQNWAEVRNEMKRDCDIEAQVPAMVAKYADGYDRVRLYTIVPADTDTAASILTMTIKDAKGMTGGVFSGAKSITVEGTLKQDGRILGTFTAQRASSIGRGISMGRNVEASTCKLLSQCATAIGKDVARWLEKPTMNAQLGTAGRKKK